MLTSAAQSGSLSRASTINPPSRPSSSLPLSSRPISNSQSGPFQPNPLASGPSQFDAPKGPYGLNGLSSLSSSLGLHSLETGPRFDSSDFPSLSDSLSGMPDSSALSSEFGEDFPALSSLIQSPHSSEHSESDFSAFKSKEGLSRPSSSTSIKSATPTPSTSSTSSSSSSHLPSSTISSSSQNLTQQTLQQLRANSKSTGPDKYGLTGLLGVIRMTDGDLNTLALGTDLTTLGLNLNSTEVLYATFAYPMLENPARRESSADYVLPVCYYQAPPPLYKLPQNVGKFSNETLFYIFYGLTRDALQVLAAKELYNRNWRYHKEMKLFFLRHDQQRYYYFDITTWDQRLWQDPATLGGPAKWMLPEELAQMNVQIALAPLGPPLGPPNVSVAATLLSQPTPP